MNRITVRILRSAVLFHVLGSALPPAAGQDDFSGELPRIPPTEPAAALATFAVADGFSLEQVAAEPLISSPVAIEWDALGRMYVCEMRGYSENRDDALSRITRLEDTDGDGVYDQSRFFVDGLLWPTAIFPFKDGLFVGDAPNVYYFQDVDGDGTAEHKQVVLTGFGTSNVQGLLNSFRWGLDHRIHIACSSAGGEVRRAADAQAASQNIRGRDLALDPRTFEFELTSGAAQHGMCFDDWGRKFVSSNSNHIQQVMYAERYMARNPYMSPPPARLMIAADGPQAEVFRTSPVEPWRIVRTRLRVKGLVPGPVEGGGRAAGYFTGASGVTIYRGDAWPAAWEGTAIVGDVGSNLVHRKRLTSHGLTFLAERIDAQSELVTSNDIWFRPAQFANGPDGALYIIDVCREVIEHPKSLPPDIKRHLDLTAGRDRGRIYRLVPDGFQHRPAPRLATATTEELVHLLEHPNAWHRETAARLLYERQDPSAVAALQRLVKTSPSALGRMHALYSLEGLAALDEETLLPRLSDAHSQVRRHAILLSEKLPLSTTLEEALVGLAEDDALEVRYQLAFTIGRLDGPERLQVLERLIRRDESDEWMQAAVQSSLVSGAGELFAGLVKDTEFRSAAAGRFLQKLAAQIARQNRESEIHRVLEALPALSHVDASWGLPILGELRHGVARSANTLPESSNTASPKTPSGKTTAAGWGAWDVARSRMIAAAIAVAERSSTNLQQHVSAINALEYGEWDEVERTLQERIDPRQPHQIQVAAISTLGKFDSPSIAPTILKAWSNLSPQLREVASEVLFARTDRTIALFMAVQRGEVSMAELSRSRLQLATRSKNESLRAQARKFLEAAGVKQRQAVIDDYRLALQLPGDKARGREQFRQHCAACHRVEGVGHEIGPNLATVKTRGAETILVNVLDPNREVNPQYLNYAVLTEDDRTLTGMIVSENATSITLQRAEAASDTVLRTDIQQIRSTGLSIMPEGLERTISPAALADLIAYLMQVP